MGALGTFCAALLDCPPPIRRVNQPVSDLAHLPVLDNGCGQVRFVVYAERSSERSLS
jgi:hypothetical protein